MRIISTLTALARKALDESDSPRSGAHPSQTERRMPARAAGNPSTTGRDVDAADRAAVARYDYLLRC